MKILIVHDDERFVSKLSELLQADGHQLVIFPVIVDARDLFEFCKPDVCVVALEPDSTSRESFEAIAKVADERGTLVIACAQTLDQRSTDLISECGANLFMFKRTEPALLLAQIQRHAARISNASAGGTTDISIRLNHRARTALVGNTRTELSRNEFMILDVLMKNANKLMSRNEIMALGELSAEIDVRNIDVHIFKLRKKLGPAGRIIRTVRSEGYMYVQEPKKGDQQLDQ